MAHATELLLIRHAHHLHQPGAPERLSATGLEQAQQLALYLANHPELRPEALCSSPLPRARETAESLAAGLGLTVELEPDLEEARLNLASASAEAQQFSAWEKFRLDVTAAPAPGAESFAAFQARVVTAVGRIASLHARKRIAIVCHGGTVECLFFHFLKIRLEDNIAVGPLVSHTGVTHFAHEELLGVAGFRLQFFNSTAHLE